MRRKRWLFFVAPPAILLFIALGGWIVMLLWNWLVPAIIGWRVITFWQALGLLLLCRILFGRWGGGGSRRGSMGDRMSARWQGMTPEEREQFRRRMRERCGFQEPAADEGGQRP
jgi:hypothetical protein